jgi:hypothetical protein
MNNYDLIQTLGLITDHAELACKLIRDADLKHGQSNQPIVATPANPNPPTPDDLRAMAQQQRAMANAEISLVCGLCASLTRKPDAPTAPRLVGLTDETVNGHPHDGSTQ